MTIFVRKCSQSWMPSGKHSTVFALNVPVRGTKRTILRNPRRTVDQLFYFGADRKTHHYIGDRSRPAYEAHRLRALYGKHRRAVAEANILAEKRSPGHVGFSIGCYPIRRDTAGRMWYYPKPNAPARWTRKPVLGSIRVYESCALARAARRKVF